MPYPDHHPPGEFCWVDLATTDVPAAKAFYNALFGWEMAHTPMPEGIAITMLRIGGRELGALFELDEQRRRLGVPPHWSVYVATDDADALAAKARDLGATVPVSPFDIFDAGRMAVLHDPQGAVFCLWQPNKHMGSRVWGEMNAPCWVELATTDAAGARDFYSRLFGWGTKIGAAGAMEYTEWIRQGQSIGGLLQITEEWKGAPPHWLTYFMVQDCDATAAQARQRGGRVLKAPTDIPNVGRFALLADPQGAVFAIIRLG